MRDVFAKQHAALSKPDAKELDTRNRESGLPSAIRVHAEEVGQTSLPPGGVLVQFVDDVPQITAKGQDGTSYQLSLGDSGVPIGAVSQWAGTSDPAGGQWLICDGRTLSTTTYSVLYGVCGTTWNIGGEAAGTFRIPDTRSRSPIGAGQGTGLSNRALGSRFGEESHLTTVAEMPAHAHPGSTDSPGHHHTIPASHTHAADFFAASAGSAPTAAGITTSVGGSITGDTSHDHALTISNTGGGGSHNNMGPSLGINFIIRAL